MDTVLLRFSLMTAIVVAGGFALEDWRVLWVMIPVIGLTVCASFIEIEGKRVARSQNR